MNEQLSDVKLALLKKMLEDQSSKKMIQYIEMKIDMPGHREIQAMMDRNADESEISKFMENNLNKAAEIEKIKGEIECYITVIRLIDQLKESN